MQTGGGISEYKNLKFLNYFKISDFDTLHELFFSVLAKPLSDENRQKSKFAYLPYLNSSIFQKQSIEKELSINALENSTCMQIYAYTSLFDENHKKRTGESKFLEYLFEFLDAFDFGESANHEQVTQKSDLISSAVLGQVFERLNGYKDGSFYTPSFITSYMCKGSIDKVILAKFSEFFGSNLANLDDLEYEIYKSLKNAKENRAQIYKNLNAVIDSIKVCDPAVGSGYFLVSALNYIIALKSNLGILIDENAKPLKAEILLEFDELRVFEFDGSVFKYTRPNSENEPKHIIQKTLFKEKAKIIENCLFGVDINPNSCEIARLRLWIELLKNSYFTDFSPNPLQQNALETLPNIDINIKCGNSLVSYFALKNKFSIPNISYRINQYKHAVNLYKAGLGDKMLISNEIKNLQITFKNLCFANEYKEKVKKFKSECDKYSQKYGDFLAKDDLRLARYVSKSFFVDIDEETAKKDYQKLLKLYDETFSLDNLNPFEWRFEFPEILDENGDFMGFDLIIANPPYISAPSQMENQNLALQRQSIANSKKFKSLYQKWDLYIPFIELGISMLCKPNGICAMIVPYPFTNQNYATNLRKMIIDKFDLFELSDLQGVKVFDAAVVTNCILFMQNQKSQNFINISKPDKSNDKISMKIEISKTHKELIQDKNSFIWNTSQTSNINKHSKLNVLGDFCYISVGMVLNADEKTAKGEFTKADLISNTQDEIHPKKYIEAKDIEKYKIKRIRYLEYDTERVPSKLRRPTFGELYDRPKILTNKIGCIKAIIDENKILCDQTNRILILWKDLKNIENKSISSSIQKYSNLSRIEMEKLSQNMNLKFILGILNSKYANILIENLRGFGNIDLNPEYLRNLPIPQITPKNQILADEIINLVDKILKETDENERANLSSEIDKSVYQIYDLNADEITLIENA